MMFSDETLELLRRSGWHEGYSYDTTLYVQTYQEQGCSPPAVVVDFMSRFGGLTINDYRNVNASCSICRLDTTLYLDGLHRPQLCYEYSTLGKYLSLEPPILYEIGTAQDQHLTLLMSALGKVYSEFDGANMYFVADDGVDAIEALCMCRALDHFSLPYFDE